MPLQDYFKAELALDERTNNVVPNAVAQVYAITDTAYATPLPITDMTGLPLANLVAGPNGVYPPFRCEGQTQVLAKSSGVVTPITSVYGAVLALIPDPTTSAPGLVLTATAAGYELRAAAGESIQMRVDAGYFQYKYPSQTTWTNLIATSDIGGGGGTGAGNVLRWVAGVSPTPASPRPEGVFYEIVLAADSPVPSWATDYDTILRIAADQGGGSVPVTVTQAAHFESALNVGTTGPMSIGSVPVGTPILVAVAAGSTSAGLAVSNTNGNVWSLVASNTVTSIGSTVAVFKTVATAATSDAITVTRTPSGGVSVAVFTLDGSDGTLGNGGAVAKASSETNVTSAMSPAVTAEKDALAVFFVATGFDVTAVSPSGTSNTASQFSGSGTGNPRTLAVGIDNVDAAGSATPGITWTFPRAWTGITLVFNPN